MTTTRERFVEIVSVLTSYGFGHIYNTRINQDNDNQDPVNLRLAFEELGPSFIKIGQILSTRKDLLQPEYVVELEKLQDHVPGFDFSHVQRIFREDFDKDLDEVFNYVEEKPLASASIAQVHRAQLKNGEEVIIKVQRPDVGHDLLRDIHIFIRVLEFIPAALREVIVDPIAVLQEIEETAVEELDFRHEAKHILNFQKFNAERTVVHVPKINTEHLSERILIEEYIEGISIDDRTELLEAGYDLDDLTKKVTLSFVVQIFEDGFYHGDPHPGNIIISNNKIVYIDFGIMGIIAPTTRKQLIEIMKAIYLRDIDRLLKLVLQITDHPYDVNQSDLYEDIEYVFDSYATQSFGEIYADKVMDDLTRITRDHRLVLKREFSVLGKAIVTLQGIIADLDAEVNLMAIIQEYFQSTDFLSPKSLLQDSGITKQLLKSGLRSAELPIQISDLLNNLNSGRLNIHLSLDNMEDNFTDLNRMVNRIVIALILAAMILSSALIIINAQSTATSSIGQIFFSIASFLALWLIISILRSGRK